MAICNTHYNIDYVSLFKQTIKSGKLLLSQQLKWVYVAVNQDTCLSQLSIVKCLPVFRAPWL